MAAAPHTPGIYTLSPCPATKPPPSATIAASMHTSSALPASAPLHQEPPHSSVHVLCNRRQAGSAGTQTDLTVRCAQQGLGCAQQQRCGYRHHWAQTLVSSNTHPTITKQRCTQHNATHKTQYLDEAKEGEIDPACNSWLDRMLPLLHAQVAFHADDPTNDPQSY